MERRELLGKITKHLNGKGIEHCVNENRGIICVSKEFVSSRTGNSNAYHAALFDFFRAAYDSSKKHELRFDAMLDVEHKPVAGAGNLRAMNYVFVYGTDSDPVYLKFISASK